MLLCFSSGGGELDSHCIYSASLIIFRALCLPKDVVILLVPKWWGVPIFSLTFKQATLVGGGIRRYADTSHRGIPRQENRKPFVDVIDKLYPPDSHGDFGLFCSSKSYLDMTYTHHRQVQDSTSDIKWWSYLAIMKHKIHHHSMILMCFLIYWKSKKVQETKFHSASFRCSILQLTNSLCAIHRSPCRGSSMDFPCWKCHGNS